MDTTKKVIIKRTAELEAIKKEKEDEYDKLIYQHGKPSQARPFQLRKITLQEK